MNKPTEDRVARHAQAIKSSVNRHAKAKASCAGSPERFPDGGMPAATSSDLDVRGATRH